MDAREAYGQKDHTLQLIIFVCDLAQFVISIIVRDVVSEILVKIFMKQAVLSFGMVAVIFVDADSKFLHIYKEMCATLDIIF